MRRHIRRDPGDHHHERTTAAPSTIGSSGLTWNSTDAITRDSAIAPTSPMATPMPLTTSPCRSTIRRIAPPVRAERHANAELARRAAARRTTSTPNNPSADERDRDAGERHEDSQREHALRRATADHVVERHRAYTSRAADRATRAARGSRPVPTSFDVRQSTRPASTPSCDRPANWPMRVIDVDGRIAFVVDADVADDADDLGLATAGVTSLADRIDAGKEPVGERLADDDAVWRAHRRARRTAGPRAAECRRRGNSRRR